MPLFKPTPRCFKGLRGGQAEGGFTLLEVMISLAILAGVVVTVVASLNYHLTLASQNKDLVLATILGRGKVEEARLSRPAKKHAGDFGHALSGFSWKLSATKVADLKGVTRSEVVVSWGKDREVSLVSYWPER